jgi:hypothetical protein
MSCRFAINGVPVGKHFYLARAAEPCRMLHMTVLARLEKMKIALLRQELRRGGMLNCDGVMQSIRNDCIA